MSEKNQPLSRRGFLKGAAVTGTVAASAGLLGGFGKPQVARAQDVSWAKEVDVVVVGSGTGQVAALRAVANGLSAVVLEKASTGGGTTGISGGGIWVPNNFRMQEAGIPDSREEALTYLSQTTFGQSNQALMEAYVDNVNLMIDFLRSQGLDFKLSPTFNDYFPMWDGGKPEGRQLAPISSIEGVSGGGALTRMLQNAGEAIGVEYIFGTPAKQLILSPEGDLLGVAAEQEGAAFNVRAHRGVVIATGGFDHNAEMVAHFLRGPIYYPSAVRTNTGDGHLMGMALGANLRNMNEHWGWPVYYNEEGQFSLPALTLELGKPGGLVVNSKGHRFFNEAGPYDDASRTFFSWDNGVHAYENIPAYFIVDSNYRKNYSLAYTPAGEAVPAWIKQADTLADLATALGIDPAALEATVTHFNEFAAQGLDPDYHRGESAFDQLTGGDRARTDIPHPNLAPLTEGPFFAVNVYPGSLGTSGGLQVNENAQVLDVWGAPIPRLYAVGNASGSPMGAGYPGGGSTVGAGSTFGFLAANHLATLESN